MYALETDHLTKCYGKARGITDVTLQVHEGEVFGFIGPNGAGKSTTIRTLLNFIYPSGGSAKIFGRDCVRRAREIRKLTGYLPSEVSYYDDMRVKDLLQYSASFYGITGNACWVTLAERLELDWSRRIVDLSYGNKKKIGIVQALLHQPRLLILDEPTGGLDPLMQNRFFEILKEAGEAGTTIFFSSHILSEVQRMCERVAIIKDGRLMKVEEISKLRQNQFKKVRLELKEELTSDLHFPNIVSQEHDHRLIKLLYNGDPLTLLQHLAQLPLQNVLIEEPSLEDIFIHYYEKEESAS